IGARRGQVIRMVLQSGLILALAGIGLGVVLALGVTRLLQGLLHGVAPADPATFAAVALALGAGALLARAPPTPRRLRPPLCRSARSRSWRAPCPRGAPRASIRWWR